MNSRKSVFISFTIRFAMMGHMVPVYVVWPDKRLRVLLRHVQEPTQHLHTALNYNTPRQV